MGKNKNSTGEKDRVNKERIAYKKKKVRGYLYSPKKHIPLLDSTIAEGYSHLVYCAKAGIGWATLKEWRNRYDEFGEAYELALMKGGQKWDVNTPFVGKDFNHHLWSHVMKVRYFYQKPIVNISGHESSEELMRLILKLYCTNELDGEMFDRIHSAIKTQIDAVELPKIQALFKKQTADKPLKKK